MGRYLVSDTPDLQLSLELEAHIVCIGLARPVLQILHVEKDDHDRMVTVSCVSMNGTEVARLRLDSSTTTLAGLGSAIERESDLKNCKWECIFPKAATLTGYKTVSSKNLPQSTLLSKLL